MVDTPRPEVYSQVRTSRLSKRTGGAIWKDKLRFPKALRLLTVVLLTAACAAGRAPAGAAPGAPAAPAAVERFLQLARDRDYAEMGWVFGTSDGPILRRDPVGQVEQRMYALASLLEHDGFVVGSGSPVAGRTGTAIRFDVLLNRGTETFRVPFTTVVGPNSRWFVEQVAVESMGGS